MARVASFLKAIAFLLSAYATALSLLLLLPSGPKDWVQIKWQVGELGKHNSAPDSQKGGSIPRQYGIGGPNLALNDPNLVFNENCPPPSQPDLVYRLTSWAALDLCNDSVPLPRERTREPEAFRPLPSRHPRHRQPFPDNTQPTELLGPWQSYLKILHDTRSHVREALTPANPKQSDTAQKVTELNERLGRLEDRVDSLNQTNDTYLRVIEIIAVFLGSFATAVMAGLLVRKEVFGANPGSPPDSERGRLSRDALTLSPSGVEKETFETQEADWDAFGSRPPPGGTQAPA
jgi:hypothetical protein